MTLAEKLKAELEEKLNSEFEDVPLNEEVVSKNPTAPSLEAPEVTPETPEEAMMVARNVYKQAQEEEGMAFGNPVELAEQFNNTVISAAGAPVDVMTWAMNKASNAVFGQDFIDPETVVGGSAQLKATLNPLDIGSDRKADTYMGYTGATLGEGAAFLMGGAGIVQKTKTAGGVVGAISRSADDALRTKLGTVVAGESVVAAGAAAGRQYSEENEFGTTGSLVLEFTTGALALLSAAGAKKVLLDPLTAKLTNMTQKEALEKLSKEEIAEVVAEGQRVIAKEDGGKVRQETVIEETIGETQPLEVTVGGEKIPSEAPATNRDAEYERLVKEDPEAAKKMLREEAEANGYDTEAFHGTHSEGIKEFAGGTHFGSKGAANKRNADVRRNIEVERDNTLSSLTKQNPTISKYFDVENDADVQAIYQKYRDKYRELDTDGDGFGGISETSKPVPQELIDIQNETDALVLQKLKEGLKKQKDELEIERQKALEGASTPKLKAKVNEVYDDIVQRDTEVSESLIQSYEEAVNNLTRGSKLMPVFLKTGKTKRTVDVEGVDDMGNPIEGGSRSITDDFEEGVNTLQYTNKFEGDESFVIKDSEQAKSGELIVTDKDGNIIPLSQRFKGQETPEPTPAPKTDYEIESVYDEDGGIDYDVDEALRKIAKERDLGITGDREANSVVRNEDGEVIGGTFVSNDGDNYTFDVVVSEAADGTGVGSKLLDDVIEMPYELRDMNPDATMQVDVVSPKMKEMLERRGFEVKEEIGKDRWLMEPKDYDNVGKPKVVEATPAPKADPEADPIDASIAATKSILEGDRTGGKGARVTAEVKPHFKAVAVEMADRFNTFAGAKNAEDAKVAAQEILTRIDRFIDFDRVIAEKDYAQGSELVANAGHTTPDSFKAGISAEGNQRTSDLKTLKNMLEDFTGGAKNADEAAEAATELAKKLTPEEKLTAIRSHMESMTRSRSRGAFMSLFDGYFVARTAMALSQVKTGLVGTISAALKSWMRPLENTLNAIDGSLRVKDVKVQRRLQYALSEIAATGEYIGTFKNHWKKLAVNIGRTMLETGDSQLLFQESQAYKGNDAMSTKNHDFFARRNLNRAARTDAYNNATNPIDKSYKGFKKSILNNNIADIIPVLFNGGFGLIGGVEEVSLMMLARRSQKARAIQAGIREGVEDLPKFVDDWMEDAFITTENGGMRINYDPKYADGFNEARYDHFRNLDIPSSDIRVEMEQGIVTALNKVAETPNELGLLTKFVMMFRGVPTRAGAQLIAYTPPVAQYRTLKVGARKIASAVEGRIGDGQVSFGKYASKIGELKADIKQQKKLLDSDDADVAKEAQAIIAESETKIERLTTYQREEDYRDIARSVISTGLLLLGYQHGRSGITTGSQNDLTRDQKFAAQKVDGAPNDWKIRWKELELDFRYAEPLKGAYGMGAAWGRREISKEIGTITPEQTVEQFFIDAYMDMLLDMPAMQGAKSVSQSFSANPETREKSFTNLKRSAFPIPSELRNILKYDEEFVTDGTQGDSTQSAWRAAVGLEQDNYRLTLLGEPKRKEEPSVFSHLTPFGGKRYVEATDIDNFLLEDAMSFKTVSEIPTSVSGMQLKKFIHMDEDNGETLYSKYGQLIVETKINGKNQRQALEALIKTKAFKDAYKKGYSQNEQGTDINKGIEMMKDKMADYRSAARKKILNSKAATDYVDSDGNNIYDILKEREAFSEQPESLLESLNLK